MIENDIILRIQELLDTGFYSQRAVARMVGVSNTTVSWVQRGKRKVYRDPTRYMVPRAEGPVTRCPSCGAKTQLPCFYCELKKLLKKHHLQYHSASIEKSSLCLDVALDGDEKKRYEEIRNWRMKQENPHFYNIPDDWPWRKERTSQKSGRRNNDEKISE